MFCELELEPLPDADARALAEADAGGELPEELAQLLAERTGGNPYFVGEAIRDLRERGALERENGRLVLVGEASIPAALQEALQARLDRLDAEARELLTTAAVIGRSFGLPLLERLLPRGAAAADPLRAPVAPARGRGAAVEPRPSTASGTGSCRRSPTARLVEARRRELHLRVGEALVELHRDSPAEVYGLLAHHFAEADEPERAVEYLLKAGDAARAVYAEDEAIELYRRALGFMERTGDEAEARQTLLKIALTHHLAFDYRARERGLQRGVRPTCARAFAAGAERADHLGDCRRRGPLKRRHRAISQRLGELRSRVNLFRGLVAIGRDLDIEPDLAERFTVSDDGRSYRFTLRPDARWSDGTPVTAHDFAFTYAQMVEDEVASASWLDGVSASCPRRAHARDSARRAAEPLPVPARSAVRLFAWPRHVYERRGTRLAPRRPARRERPVRAHPAPAPPPDERTPGRITLEAAPALVRGARKRRRGDDRARSLAARPPASGGETAITTSSTNCVAELAGSSHRRGDGRAAVDRRMHTTYLGLDARRAPLDDARIRRALAHAIDRHALAPALGGTAAATGGLLPPTMPGHSHRVAPAFDPDRARALLSEAGYPDGHGLGEIVLAHFKHLGGRWRRTSPPNSRPSAFRVRRLPADSVAALEAAIEEPPTRTSGPWTPTLPDPGRGFLQPLLRWVPHFYRDEQTRASCSPERPPLRDQDERLRACREFERIWIGEQAAVVPLVYKDRLLWRRPWLTGMWLNAIARSTFAEAVVRRP